MKFSKLRNPTGQFFQSKKQQSFCIYVSAKTLKSFLSNHIVRDISKGVENIQFFFPFDCPYWPLVEVELYLDLGEVYKLAGRFFATLVSFEEAPPDLWATLTNCSK